MSYPRISVITVSLNTVHIIEKTILSVIGQNYDNIEYIIIDGGSTDGTQKIIEQYSAKISFFVSEKDGGIYFGMNKGIEASTGDFVIFLNAGDIFVDNSVVFDVASYLANNNDTDLLYGNSVQALEYGDFEIKPKNAYSNNLIGFSHQATFAKRSLLKSHLFNTEFRYASDYEQLSFFYLSGASFRYIDRAISKVEMEDGATYHHFIESAEELYGIMESRGIDVRKKRIEQLRRKRIIHFIKNIIPKCIRKPLFRFIAKKYKVL